MISSTVATLEWAAQVSSGREQDAHHADRR